MKQTDKARSLKRMVSTPAEEPCPKCASKDIYRKWTPKNAKLDVRFSEDYPAGFAKLDRNFWIVSTKEHIKHHCRCCQYEWCGECANKQS